MQQENNIVSLTTDLLANRAFSHLRDEEISSLHYCILKLTGKFSSTPQNLPVRQISLLLTFWNHANTVNLPPCLLHRCNTVLQRLGRGPMEMM